MAILNRVARSRCRSHIARLRGGFDPGRYTTAVPGGKRMTRAAAIAVICASVCSAGGALVARSVQGPETPGLEVRLHPSEQEYDERVRRTARASLELYEEWLGKIPGGPIELASREALGTASPQPHQVVVDLPWRTADSTMEVEAAVASAIALRYWPHAAADEAFARGLAWYLQSRVVEHVFNLTFARPGHSAEGLRLFGGFVPLGFPTLVMSRWSDQLARERGAVAFAALERYLRWPVLQGGLATLAASMNEAPLTPDHANQVLSRAAGQDLTWFFETSFAAAMPIDYALNVAGSTPCATPSCYRTSVTVLRNGAPFTGSSQPRVGPYDSGTAVGVEVRFGDGQTATARWDGRDARRTFEFESPSPAVSARLDPEGALLLDPTPLDHSWSAQPQTNVPITKWVARWMVWLQHAMLTYTALL